MESCVDTDDQMIEIQAAASKRTSQIARRETTTAYVKQPRVS